MLQSAELQKNPKLYLFLPLYYTLWADSVLTPTEISVMESLIEQQDWLSEEEQKFLNRQLDPMHKPKAQDLKTWKRIIKQVQRKGHESLSELGLALVKNYVEDEKDAHIEDKYLNNISSAERALGLLGEEAGYLFQDQHRTITSEYESVGSFDTAHMQAILEGEDAALIKKVKAIISDPKFEYQEFDSLSSKREQIYLWCKELAKQGLGNYAYPKEFGGQGTMKDYFVILETLSYHDLSLVIKFGVQFGLWGMSIYFLGTEKHHKKYLKNIGTLELPGCFAMTETNHGSNVRGIETTATYNHKEQCFIINTPHPLAVKEYIGNAAVHGQMATVFAKLIIDEEDYGVNAFVVPLRDKEGKLVNGVKIDDCGHKMGLNGVDNGIIHFEKVVIPKEDMLDRFSSVNEKGEFESLISSDNRRFFTMLGTLVGGRIGIPRSGLAAAKSGLTIAIRYGDQRKQFGPEGGEEVPILNYRMHQRRLIPLLAKSYALHFGLQYVTDRFMQKKDEEAQEIEALAAGMKAYGTWFTTACLQECREACGGKGYLSENRIGQLKNDTDVYTTFEGDNTVLMQLVAKSRLTEFKQEFSDMNMFTIFNYVASQAKTKITEKNPIIIRSTDEQHLRDFDFHLNAFRYRERGILTSAARRFKRHIDEGMDSFDAFNVCQHHFLNLGQAYIERIILEEFQKKALTIHDEKCQAVLKQLCQLYALYTIEQNRGWYLEQDYMEGVKTKAIRKTVNQLCWDIRQDAVALTDAFAIPQSCLAAPISFK